MFVYIYSDSGVVDYHLHTNILVKYLNNVSVSANTRIAILCYMLIESKQLLDAIRSYLRNNQMKLLSKIHYYDGGIKIFDIEFNPDYNENIESDTRRPVVDWIDTGGILLTHDSLFAGAESDVVIAVS